MINVINLVEIFEAAKNKGKGQLEEIFHISISDIAKVSFLPKVNNRSLWNVIVVSEKFDS